MKGILADAQDKITANKYSAARTGAEQAKDLDRQFVVGKKLNKITTVEHVSSSQHTLNRRFDLKFKEFSQKIHIKKQSAVINYLAKFPTIESRACVRENIVHGWFQNGMIDSTLQMLPQFHGLIRTTRRKITDKEWQLCVDSFHPLMTYAYNNGKMRNIPDQVFIDLGFPVDLNMCGNEVLCLATISQGNHQREKILTVEFETAS